MAARFFTPNIVQEIVSKVRQVLSAKKSQKTIRWMPSVVLDPTELVPEGRAMIASFELPHFGIALDNRKDDGVKNHLNRMGVSRNPWKNLWVSVESTAEARGPHTHEVEISAPDGTWQHLRVLGRKERSGVQRKGIPLGPQFQNFSIPGDLLRREVPHTIVTLRAKPNLNNSPTVSNISLIGNLDLNVGPALEFWKARHGAFLHKKNALHLLDMVYSELEHQGFEPMILFGTLLGSVREGSFIEHDKDIDLGLVEETGPNSLNQTGKKPVFERVFPSIVNNLRDKNIRLVRDRRRIKSFWYLTDYIDIYLFGQSKTPGRFVCGKYGLEKQEVGNFSVQQICGHFFRAPELTEEYLSSRYGPGWAEPVRDFHARS